MRVHHLIAAAIGTVASVALGSDQAPPSSEPFEEVLFGVRYEDPYRWMEDRGRAEEMKAWVTSASRASVARLRALPERDRFKAMLEESTRSGVRYVDPQSSGGRLFYRRMDPDAAVPKLVMRDAEGEVVLFDPTADEQKLASINNYSVAPDGRTVAVHVAKGGGEVGEVRFLDVATRSFHGPTLSPVWGEFEVTWLGQRTIAYTRMTGADAGDAMKNMRAVVVQLDLPESQLPVLGNGVQGSISFDPALFPQVLAQRNSQWSLAAGAGARADGRFFVARASDLAKGKPTWREVASLDEQVSDAALLGNRLFLLSTKGNSNGAVYVQQLETTAPRTRLYSNDRLILRQIAAAADGLYVLGQEDGVSRLMFLPQGRGAAREVALPFEGDADWMRQSMDGRSLLFGLKGWTRARELLEVTAGKVRPLGLASANWAPGSNFTTVREEAVSADGTRVPLVIMLPASRLPGGLPTILEGYGSYGVLTTSPFYSAIRAPWVARGGALAFCGTRGGGERGRLWHEAGRSANKPNAHADFIACAERLVETGITTPKQLAALGTSAGGLLVPPGAMKRPDLFAALVARVAIVNPTRLAAATNGANQFAEMGDPNTVDGLSALAAQDSYLMLATARDLPDTLVTVGMNDRRVEPWMASKFAARARERFGQKRLVLIRADTDAGHGVGSTQSQQVEEWADIFAFAWDRLSR